MVTAGFQGSNLGTTEDTNLKHRTARNNVHKLGTAGYTAPGIWIARDIVLRWGQYGIQFLGWG